ncbi:RIP metalloprotease RseP [bacterium]|nr:RIP metalloprotease RseP [bacterium]
MFITIITVILALSFLIFIHELGHYLAAKKVGVHVMEFSIGFPPKVFSRIIGKTEYIISLIPIGGYVRLKGQSIDDEDTSDPENYAAKSALERLFILVAGPLMNLLVALVLMPLVFYIGYEIPAYLNEAPVIGSVDPGSKAEILDIKRDDLILAINDKDVSTWKEAQSQILSSKEPIILVKIRRGQEIGHRALNSGYFSAPEGIGWHARITPVIGKISPNSPAENAGLQLDDNLIEINNVKIYDWSQISPIIQNSNGNPVSFVIDRNGQRKEYMISPTLEDEYNYWIIGISSKTEQVSENFTNSITLGAKRVYYLTTRTFVFLFRLITGQEKSDSVGGPIMIAKMMGQAAQTSISSLLTLVAFISLQFCIFNLLPIPALDGGHVLFLVIEKISGKTLSKSLRLSIQRIGFSLLMFLILYISVQDGLRLFGN